MTAVAANASAAVTLAAEAALYVSGQNGTAQVLPPAPPGAEHLRVIRGSQIMVGPFRQDTTVLLVAGAAGLRYNITTSASVSRDYTRAEMISLAQAYGLTPFTMYHTVEGCRCFAVAPNLFECPNWYDDGTRWAVGGVTAWKNLTYFYLPPAGSHFRMSINHSGSFTNSTRTKKLQITLGGTLTDAPGSNNDYLFDRTFNGGTTYDWETDTYLRCMGSPGVQAVRAVGTSSPGIGTTVSRMLANTSLAAGNALFRVAGFSNKGATPVTITGLQISGGYAYGSVAAGTFTDLALLRTAQISGVTGGNATYLNVDPIDCDLLTAGLPNPVVAPIGTAASSVTEFRYPVTGGSGAAAGSPVITLYDDLALQSLLVGFTQGKLA